MQTASGVCQVCVYRNSDIYRNNINWSSFIKHFHMLDYEFVGIISQYSNVTEGRFILGSNLLDLPIYLKPYLITTWKQNVDKSVLREEIFICVFIYLYYLLILTYSVLKKPRLQFWRDFGFFFSESVQYSSAKDHSFLSCICCFIQYLSQ
jgi:hypothetical protein